MNKNCPKCGKLVKEGYLFCGKCGYKFPKEIAPIKEPPKKEIDEVIEKKEKKKIKPFEETKKEVFSPKEPAISKKSKSKTKLIIAVIVFFIIIIIAVVVIISNSNISDSIGTSGVKDTDNDGYNDEVDEFPYDSDEWKDTDNDGYGDNSDVFPYDSTEWRDSDNDGYGDNSDVFPYDSTEWRDSDNDGYGDNSDAFPYDSSEHLDSDGDGVGDNKDVFPYNPDETKDSDNDGIGDNADIDDDNDGYADSKDYLPYADAKIKISILEFAIWDEIDIDFWPSTKEGEIYFEISVNNVKKVRFPSTGTISADIQTFITAPSNWYIYIDLEDDKQTHTINIVMYDDDTITQELLDIDGSDDTEGLTIIYDIVTNNWTGDDTDGITDGRNDGTYSSDDNDAYLKYDITAV